MVQPLTKRDKTGKIYARPPIIEASIDVALAQDVATLRARALVKDRASPEYLPSECLVHLIRDAIRRDEPAVYNTLTPILLSRCEVTLRSKLPDSSVPNAAALRDDVLSEIGELLASEGAGAVNDELDYFECRFNHAFRALRIDMIRKEARRAKRTVPISTNSSEIDIDVFNQLSDAVRAPETAEQQLWYRELLKAIEALSADDCKAVFLCRVLGYEEESDDPTKTTAATICGVTGRTIRNRLHRAAALLSKFNQEHI